MSKHRKYVKLKEKKKHIEKYFKVCFGGKQRVAEIRADLSLTFLFGVNIRAYLCAVHYQIPLIGKFCPMV